MALTAAYTMMKKREESGSNEGLRVLVVAPSIIVPKWSGSEIPTILGHKITKTTVLNNTEDALKYVRKVKSGHKPKKGTIEFVLVSTDRMKLGPSKYVLGAKWNPTNETWTCPDCGHPLTTPSTKEEEKDLLSSWSDVVSDPVFPPSFNELEDARNNGTMGTNNVPNGYIKKWTKKIRKIYCGECHEYNDTKQCNKIVVRPALKSKGETKNRDRWMIAQIFQRKLSHHFHLGIYDEIQMFKGNDTGRGLAFHKMLKSTRKNLFLTGTLTNGDATSIQATLWRSDPKALLDDGFNHETSDVGWAKRYGVLEKSVTRKDEGVVGVSTNRRQSKVITKIKPGISPKLTANHLLHKSVFMDLGDLGLPLVKKEEIPVIVPMDEHHQTEYHDFHNALYDTCLDVQKELGSGAWARFNPSTLNYADQPHIEQNIQFFNEGEYLGGVSAPQFDEGYVNAKERKLIDITKDNLADRRGCIIYNHFTGKYSQNERLKRLLEHEGVSVEILDTKVSAKKRFEWLEKQKKKGTKVLIMNMSLVQVGLDLLEWPTMIYYQLNDNLNVLRQAGGRNWRIGQHRNVKIYYLVNEKSQQINQFERLMTRRIEALLVEGRIGRSDPLAQFAKNNESKLARDLSFSLSATELEETWKSASEKDIDQSIEMVDENKLQERIKEAFKTLTEETKQLCGVPLHESYEEEARNVVEFKYQGQENHTTPPSNDAVDLFNFEQFIVDTIKPKKKGGKEIEQVAFDLF